MLYRAFFVFCARPPRYILSHTLLFCLRPPATLLATRFYATHIVFLCQRAKLATLFLLLLCHTFSLALNALGAFCSLIICATLFARPRSIHHTHKPNHPSMPRVFLFLFAHPRAKPFKRHTHRIFFVTHISSPVFMPFAP